MDVNLEIPDPPEEEREEASEAAAFAGLSEVHSDNAERFMEESGNHVVEAEAAAIAAIATAEIAENSADQAISAATAAELSNAEIAARLDRIPEEIAAAVAAAMLAVNAAEEMPENEIDESGEVVPLAPDEEPVVQQKFHHKLIGGSGGIYRNKRR